VTKQQNINCSNLSQDTQKRMLAMLHSYIVLTSTSLGASQSIQWSQKKERKRYSVYYKMDLRELHHKGTGLTGMPTTIHLGAGYTLPISEPCVYCQDRDRIFVRQYGQSAHFHTHGSKHMGWNLCPQRSLTNSSPS
jgi:hypothetical protein